MGGPSLLDNSTNSGLRVRSQAPPGNACVEAPPQFSWTGMTGPPIMNVYHENAFRTNKCQSLRLFPCSGVGTHTGRCSKIRYAFPRRTVGTRKEFLFSSALFLSFMLFMVNRTVGECHSFTGIASNPWHSSETPPCKSPIPNQQSPIPKRPVQFSSSLSDRYTNRSLIFSSISAVPRAQVK